MKACFREEYMEKLHIGFDLGGTKMLAGIVDGKNTVIAKAKRKTLETGGGKAVVDDIIELLQEVTSQAGLSVKDIAGVGMAVPGLLDRKRGRVAHTPNLGFHDFPLVDKIRASFDVPVLLENDVNAGVYGEFVMGAARGYKHVLGAFPGTGIGGGLIINGQLYSGAGGNAGEIGHMVLQLDGPPCGCGQYGHIEGMASRTAMAKDIVQLIASGTITGALAEYGTDIRNISSKFFAQGVKEENPHVIRVIDRAAEFLGISLAGSVNLLNPEVVVIGGGLIEKLGDFYLSRIGKALKKAAMPFIAKDLTLKAAELGDNAGLIGSAALARQGLGAR